MGLEKLTNHARASLLRASKIAIGLRDKTVTTTHLILAIMEENGSVGRHLLTTVGITDKNVKQLIAQTSKNKTKAATRKRRTTTIIAPPISRNLKEIITNAYHIAGKNGYPYVGTEHIAYAIINTAGADLQNIMNDAQIKKEVINNIANLSQSDSPIPNLAKLFDFQTNDETDDGDDNSALQHFCTPVQIDDDKIIVGRDTEVDRMITILGRKEKSNPLLVGDPGVGKTAIVEALAGRIASGSVPALLLDAQILTLDMATIVAGTTFRGEFEARIKDIISEAEENQNIILFIDELHTIMGAGNASGTLDAANILKPALARGSLRIIGATTHTEYKKHIAKDSALARRFQSITIHEPSRDDCITMLTGIRGYYEKFHGVTITSDLLTQIVDLSIRYLPDRFLPDKALDIVDEAAAAVKMAHAHDPKLKEVAALRRTIESVTTDKLTAVDNEKYDIALNLRTEEQFLTKKLDKLAQSINRGHRAIILTSAHVTSAIAILAKIPQNRITTDTPGHIVSALAAWQKTIVGQTVATTAITKTIMRSYSGLAPEKRPSGSFLFLGPSGIGKTLTATTLAQSLFGDNSLIRIDMSELMEKHSIAKLIGAPAGYVGHEEGGSLTERIRIRPYSVVLFDEIEKAHPDTLNILLQILEDGHLTDAQGNRADFRHAVIILTSNIGTKELTSAAQLGFAAETNTKSTHQQFNATKDRVLTTLREHIAPELLGRIDDIIVFDALGPTELTRIARIELAALRTRLVAVNVKLRIAPAVATVVATQTDTLAHGARGIRREIRRHIEDALAEILLSTTRRPLTISVTTTRNDAKKPTIKVAQSK